MQTWWHYVCRLHQFQGDVIAGIAVGLTAVPQSLAYAKIAELPPQVYIVYRITGALSINQSIMIFSVAQIVNYYWDHESVYGKTSTGTGLAISLFLGYTCGCVCIMDVPDFIFFGIWLEPDFARYQMRYPAWTSAATG